MAIGCDQLVSFALYWSFRSTKFSYFYLFWTTESQASSCSTNSHVDRAISVTCSANSHHRIFWLPMPPTMHISGIFWVVAKTKLINNTSNSQKNRQNNKFPTPKTHPQPRPPSRSWSHPWHLRKPPSSLLEKPPGLGWSVFPRPLSMPWKGVSLWCKKVVGWQTFFP